MPISIKDYEWEENDSLVFITVPLKGVKTNKVDIISTENYIKVSFPPYLFECFLFAATIHEDNLGQIGKGVVTFKLTKAQSGLWKQLQIYDLDNKDVTKQIRNEALLVYQEKTEKIRSDRAEEKRIAEKYALNKMMKIENEERERIENVKQSEREKATRELEEWKELQMQAAILEKNKKLQECKEKHQTKKGTMKGQEGKDIYNHHEDSVTATRNSGTIEVSFTPRVFPTPVRESVTPQEQEWLKKQAEMRNICESLDKDLTVQERDPMWLRDKGNEFFKSGDLHAAINAFSQAIRLNSSMPALFSNRAACHMKLGNYMKCIEDCSKALDHLTPPVPQNQMSRCKALVRRGTAFCQLQLYVEGLHEYEAAIKLDPNNESLRQDADRIRRIIEGASHAGV